MTNGESSALMAPSLRAEALEQLLAERGLVEPGELDAIITTYETNVGPLNGAKVVAKAWTGRRTTGGLCAREPSFRPPRSGQ